MPTIGAFHVGAVIIAFGCLFIGRKFLEGAGLQVPAAAPAGGDRGRNGAGGGGEGRGEMALAKWMGLLFHFAAGVAFAAALIAVFRWLIEWGQANTAGWVASALSVSVVAVGWWALDGIVGLVKDLADGVPDKEAHTAALLVPTTWPVGLFALIDLFRNPQGFPTTLAGVFLSAIGVFFIGRIISKGYNRSSMTRAWNWAIAIICLLAGLMHIPAFIYGNQWLGELTFAVNIGPVQIGAGEVPNAIRLGIGMFALGLIFGMVGDFLKGRQAKNRKSWSPGKITFLALQLGVPVLVVVGAVVLNGFDSVIFTQAQ